MTTNNHKTADEILAEQTGAPDYAKRSVAERADLLTEAHSRLGAGFTKIDTIIALESAILAISGFNPRERIAELEVKNTQLAADAEKARQEADEAAQKLNGFTREHAFDEFRERIALLMKENAALAAMAREVDSRVTAKVDEIMAQVGFHMPIPQDFSGAHERAGSLTEQCIVRRHKS